MRSLSLVLVLLIASAALAQTPPPETIDFENLPNKTPMPYKPNDPVPDAARLKSVPLAGGGSVSVRTRDGAKYVALVSHLGTTAIVGVSKKGKIQQGRALEIRIKKNKTAAFDAFTAIQAAARVDDQGTTDTSDDVVVAYDNPGAGEFYLYDMRKRLYPTSGARLVILRTAPKAYDLTTTSLAFPRIIIYATGGGLVFDDLVVSYGH